MKYLKDKKITIGSMERESYPGSISEFKELDNCRNIWAYYRHLEDKEFFNADIDNYEIKVLFVINYKPNIERGMIVKFRNKKYQIFKVDDFEGYKEDIKLYAKLLDSSEIY